MYRYILSILTLLISLSGQAHDIRVTITAEIKAPGSSTYQSVWVAHDVIFSVASTRCEFKTGLIQAWPCNVTYTDSDSIRDSRAQISLNEKIFRYLGYVSKHNRNLPKGLFSDFYRYIREDESNQKPVQFYIYEEPEQSLSFSNKYHEGISRITITQH